MMDFLSHQKQRKRLLWQLMAASMLLFLVAFTLNSCSTENYNTITPLTQQTSATLISPQTLKSWVDGGIVNSSGSDRVVILDVTSLGTYTTGHIPGAQYANSADINQNRLEGPAVDINMNADGPHMDAFIQKYGIDKNTTIVFTSGGAASAGTVLSATRAYWIFRYWGFPKEKLKLLDGINFSYAAAYGLTTDASPTPVPSTYSVKNNARLRTDLRASLLDMINVAEGRVANAVPIDMRSSATDGSYAGKRGSTSGVFNPGSDFTAFEGRIKGAKALLYSDLFDATNNYRFKSPDILAKMFKDVGIDGTKYTHVYWRTGVIASSAFFVLDAILNWPVANYDGSWSQWGQMSGSPANGGMLNPSSPMRTDIPSRSELVVYNYDTTPGPVFFTGTGLNDLNDMTVTGTFTGTANRTFRVLIDGVGTPDTVSLFQSAPTGTLATSQPISAGTTTVLEGLTIAFGAATGHTAGDRWDFITKRAVELLAFDGSICSSSTSVAGVTTFSPAGCTPLLPNSYATGNEIEDADAAYFGAGGGSSGGGGGGGGGPIAPGY